ncbi:MAG: LysR family transcriptional regulator [Actinomycetia bacterium]|nr:LysR family transcriptional regulator [Actinomycetes bacterium]
MLDVHRLRVFRSVVASGSIQAAATNLGYTPSAVSQHVATLQRETGLSLITRVGRGIEPTAAGRSLAGQVDGVLTRLGEVETLVGDLRSGRTGSLALGYFASAGSAWMPRVVRALVRDFPDVRLDLSLRDDFAEDPSEWSDIQVIVEQEALDPPVGLRSHHLLDDPYVAVLPRTHRLAAREQIELADLANDEWVDNDFAGGWCRRNLIEACRAAGFAPPFNIEALDYPMAIAFVEAGIGVTVMPRLGAASLPSGVVAVTVTSPTPMRSIYAVVRTAIEDTPPARTVLEILAATAAEAR